MRWRQNFGDDPREPDVLEALIVTKVEEAKPRLQRDELAKEDAYDAFVRLRFGHHLRNYRTFGGWYGLAFTLLSVVAIASGTASAAIAAGWQDEDFGRITIVVLGLSAAIAAAVNQLWRPAEKAASRIRGANALSREGWAYLLGRGRYRSLADGDALTTFIDEVTTIVSQTAAVDEAIGEGARPGAAPT